MEGNDKKHAAFCPNCQQPAIKQGNQIICEKCDATFAITKTGAAKVKQTGRIEQIEMDIAEIKTRLSIEEPEPAEEPGPTEEPGPAEEDEDW